MTAPASGTEVRINPGRCQQHHRRVWWVIRPPDRAPCQPPKEARLHIHFTPTSGSWLNLVEVWFGIIERQAIHRGAFPSVRDLMIKIRAFINGWNGRCQPFVWIKTAEEILTKPTVK